MNTLQYHNTDLEQLIREAECSDNALALAITQKFENPDDESESKYDLLLDDMAVYFADMINDKIDDYVNDYYLNPKSDYFDFLYDFELEDDEISLAYPDADLDVVMDRLRMNLEYYCEVDICGNYARPNGIMVASAMIGEIEEPLDMITNEFIGMFSDDETAEKILDHVKENIHSAVVGDFIYIDLSDHSVNLMVRSDRIDELLEPQE